MPFYNTGLPTASNKNTINDIAVAFGIRDFLLNRNLTSIYNNLASSYNGAPKVGEPFLDTVVGTNTVLQHIPIEVDGILRVENATLMNQFKDTGFTANQFVSIDTILPLKPLPSVEDDSKFRVENATRMNDFRDSGSTANQLLSVDTNLHISPLPSVEDDSKFRVENAVAMNKLKNSASTANQLIDIEFVTPTASIPTIDEDSKLRVENAVAMNNFKDSASTANLKISIEDVTNPSNDSIDVTSFDSANKATITNIYKDKSSTANQLFSITNVSKTVGQFPNSTVPNGIDSYDSTTAGSYGILPKTVDANYLKKNTVKNLYLDSTKQIDVADWIASQPQNFNQQLTGYLDQYGKLNDGNSGAIQAADIVGSILNGQGLGLAKGGVVPNFDIRASLAGRVLGSAGILGDTKLGLIGGQQLALALANNAAFNTEQRILGTLNVADNVLSLVKNGTLAGFRPNYNITIPAGGLGRALDTTAQILGFTLPKSYLDDAGSIFLSESNSANIQRANSMLLHTGAGQVTALMGNMNANLIGTTQFDNPSTTPFRSGYAPGYKDNKGQKAINPNTYAFGDADGLIYNFIAIASSGSSAIIPEISYNRSNMIEKYGFVDMPQTSFDTGSFPTNQTWNTDVGGTVNSEYTEGTSINVGDDTTKKTLLVKTQKLFNDVGMKNIISSKGQMGLLPSQIQTAVVGGGISKGSAVLTANAFSGHGTSITNLKTAQETYCRAWTSHSRYSQVQNLIRHRSIDDGNPYRFHTDGTVLGQNGFVKIAPYTTDRNTDVKKFMLSIENLAWADDLGKLLPSEIGSGDLLSGKKGRIMWFPPYDINFTENTSANWESTNFIGRGEPVYTYNNTERSGTLSFKIVVDHPSYLNAFRGSSGPLDEYIDSYFAGCVDLDPFWAEKLTTDEQQSVSSRNVTDPQKKNITPQTPPDDFKLYFPNDVDALPVTYENGLCGSTPIDYSNNPTGNGCGLGSYNGQFTSNSVWTDNTNFGLNTDHTQKLTVDGVEYSAATGGDFIAAVNSYLTNKCPACRVEVTGYASSQGDPTINQTIANARANVVSTFVKSQLLSGRGFSTSDLTKRVKVMPSAVVPNSGVNGEPVDALLPKSARYVKIHFVFDSSFTNDIKAEPVVVATQAINVTTRIKNRFYDESRYFDELKETDEFIFDKIRNKIKYFHPAFHSTTPEGLNSRLTFLQQCMRQGPTLGNDNTNNLVFGRPPVCILRIGDFYNTKIVIDNIGVDFEPLVWDLNPEGVGVQPMIANVNISFKFIGGSTLLGPINKLQNALSFNYYANSHVYDTRADYIALDASANVVDPTTGQVVKYGATLVNGDTKLQNVEVTITQQDIGAQTPVLDQTAANDLATSGGASQTQQPITTDPIITDFMIQSVTSGSTGWNIAIKGLTQNANTDSDKNKLFNNGVIFSLSDTTGFKHQEIGLDSTQFNTIFFSTGGVITFRTSTFPAGTYMIKLKNGSNTQIKKSIILK